MNCHKLTYVAFGREMVRYTFTRKELVERALTAICPSYNSLVFHPCDVYSYVPGTEIRIPLSSEVKYVTTKRGRLRIVGKRKRVTKHIQSKSIFWSRGFELFEDEFLRVYGSIDEEDLRGVAREMYNDLLLAATQTNQTVLNF